MSLKPHLRPTVTTWSVTPTLSRVLKRFDYHRCNKHDRCVLLRYLQHTSSYTFDVAGGHA
nr:hypothetical protein [Rhodoferax sp.]